MDNEENSALPLSFDDNTDKINDNSATIVITMEPDFNKTHQQSGQWKLNDFVKLSIEQFQIKNWVYPHSEKTRTSCRFKQTFGKDFTVSRVLRKQNVPMFKLIRSQMQLILTKTPSKKLRN